MCALWFSRDGRWSNYELFERMHSLCFHLQFEHNADVDAPCSDQSCPWFVIDALRRGLSEAGIDPAVTLMSAIARRAGNGAVRQ